MAAELFIARLPTLNRIEVVEAELATGQRHGSFLQHLKSKCRELARSESGLLVSPTTAALHCPPFSGPCPPMTLWIMATADYLGSAKMQEKLKHLGIKILRRVGMSEGVLQTCYQFSLTARLAPKWNLLSCWLVQGMDFLSSGRSHAVVLEVGVTRTEITLSVKVSRINFNFLQVSDMEVSVSTLGSFMRDPRGVITETSIYQNRCILLPNLTVGYVFSASHQLPSSPGFTTYDSIRLHWKKQHGMILPEKQDLFFQIFFKSNSRTFFSYPGCCVLKCPPTLTSGSRDSRFVAASFISDLHSRMPSLCGEAVRYSNKALTPLARLQTAATPTNYPNIRAVPGPSRPTSLAPPTSLGAAGKGAGLIRRASAALAFSSGHVTPSNGSHSGHVTSANGGHVISANGINSGHVTSANGSRTVPQTVPGSGSTTGTLHSQRDRNDAPNKPPTIQGTASTRIVPVFKPTQSSSRQSIPVPQTPAKKSAPVVPSFKPSRAPSRPQTVPTLPGRQPQGPHASRQTPSSTSQQSSGQSGKKRSSVESSLAMTQPPQKQCRTNTASVSATSSSTIGRGRQESRVGEGRTAAGQQRSLGTSACGWEQTVPDLSLMMQTDTDCLSTSLDTQPSNTAHSGTTQKKGKAVKTAVQVEGVNKETMSKITKTKVPLLKKWLQEKGVKVAGRKTKDELVKMAAEYTRDTGTTFNPPPP